MKEVTELLAAVRVYDSENPHTSCWIWNGSYDGDTPSQYVNGVRLRVYDVFYRSEFGDDPPTIYLGNHCGVPGCVNPLHDRRAPRPPRVLNIMEGDRDRSPVVHRSHAQ